MADVSIPSGSLFVALPTPFDDRGRIDEGALTHLVDYVLDQRAAGVALLTEAGEDAMLSPEDRRALVEQVGDRLRGKKSLLVQISASSTREAVDLARVAEGQGALGILLAPLRVPGLGYRSLYRHVDKIGRTSDLPIYLVVRAENAIDSLVPEEVSTLIKHSAVRGAFLPQALPPAIAEWSARFRSVSGEVFSGCSLRFRTAWRAGATGVICGVSILATELAVELMAFVTQKADQEVIEIEKRVASAVRMLGPPECTEDLGGLKRFAARLARRPLEGGLLRPWVPFELIKQGLKLQGHPIESFVCPPYEKANAHEVEKLKIVLRGAGIIS